MAGNPLLMRLLARPCCPPGVRPARPSLPRNKPHSPVITPMADLQSRQNPQIIANPPHVVKPQRDFLLKRNKLRQIEHAACCITKQAWRVIEQQFVNHAGRKQRSVELAARFDMHFIHAAAREFAHDGREIGLALRVGEHHHFGTAIRERLDFLAILDGAEHQQAAALKNACGGRDLQF